MWTQLLIICGRIHAVSFDSAAFDNLTELPKRLFKQAPGLSLHTKDVSQNYVNLARLISDKKYQCMGQE